MCVRCESNVVLVGLPVVGGKCRLCGIYIEIEPDRNVLDGRHQATTTRLICTSDKQNRLDSTRIKVSVNDLLHHLAYKLESPVVCPATTFAGGGNGGGGGGGGY